MNQGDERPGRSACFRCVMVGDDLQYVGCEVPMLSERISSLAMRESHDRPFRLIEGNLFAAREFKRRRKLSRKGDAVHHEAQIMQ